ncbi:MAG: Co2+/Mg2+ efflux protein ApaG [Roseiflexaceae bacterium]
MPHRPFYYKETAGFRVSVHPEFLPEDSDAHNGRYVFSYEVRIENCTGRSAQLLTRHWDIVDDIGEQFAVDGDGVVGQQPLMQAGDVHEYRSFCVLKSPRGSMGGYYTFVRANGDTFDVQIPTFILAVRQE